MTPYSLYCWCDPLETEGYRLHIRLTSACQWPQMDEIHIQFPYRVISDSVCGAELMSQVGTHVTLQWHPPTEDTHFLEWDFLCPAIRHFSDGPSVAYLKHSISQQTCSIRVHPMLQGERDPSGYSTLPSAQSPCLIPAPKYSQTEHGVCALTEHDQIGYAPEARHAVLWLKEALFQDTGLMLMDSQLPQGKIQLHLEPTLTKQSYRLRIEPERIHISASDHEGFCHAIATLLQLLPAQPVCHCDVAWTLPCVFIEDSPRFQYRGFMLDCARHFQSLHSIRKLIDEMARLKLNTFHWHLTDDEGWRLEIQSIPQLTELGAWRGEDCIQPGQFGSTESRYGGYYTHEDVRDIVEYAYQRGITVVPEIDVPGHCRAALYAMPELQEMADSSQYISVQHYRDNVLSPGLPATYDFLEKVLSEVCQLFPGPYVHLGADEVPEGVWTQSPSSQRTLRQHGMTDERDLQGHLLRYAQEILSRYDKQMMGWEEAMHGSKITNHAVLFPWTGEEAARRAVKAGYQVVMQPGQFTYLDHAQSEDWTEPGYHWATPSISLETLYRYEPVNNSSDLNSANVLGVQGALFSELIVTQARQQYMIFPRLQALAETCWSPATHKNWPDFEARLHHSLMGLSRRGINYRNPF